MKIESQMKKASTKPRMPRSVAKKRERSVSQLRSSMNTLGVELDDDDQVR